MKVFEICLTNYCNFKCTYCISDPNRGCDKFSQPIKKDENNNLLVHPFGISESENNSAHDKGDWIDLEILLKFIRTKLSNEWLINLTGGEPLYYPKIEEFIVELSKTHKILITTNASILREKKDFLNIDRDSIFFRIGYHPEFRNLDTFLDIMKYIHDNKFKYIINYVTHPEYYTESEKYLDHITILESNGLKYEITPFEGKFNNTNYPKLRHLRNEIECKLFNTNINLEPFNSEMGLNFIICEPDGKIYECQGKSKNLGDVYENKLELERIGHNFCFQAKGCAPQKSAILYLRDLLGTAFK